MIFCSLFNKLYLPQGVALYRSLERTAGDGFVLYLLCMDEYSAAALARFNFPHLRIIDLAAIEDDALRRARANRSFREYCWTCTTSLLLHVQDLHPAGSVVTYVDADISFFSDPSAILAELGDRNIFIHEHDFAPEHAHYLPAGRFNVGVAAFRNNDEGRTCLKRWKAQCLDDCSVDLAAGKCGDQHYLDDWPQLYSGLVISSNPGVGLGPWNITKRRLELDQGKVTVDGRPVIFYHYHGLRILRPRLGVTPVFMANSEYLIDPNVVHAIYRPYVQSLAGALDDLKRLGFPLAKEFEAASRVRPPIETRQLLFAVAGTGIPNERNLQTIRALYEFDAVRAKLARVWERWAQGGERNQAG
jgi:hypothetical protein